MSVATREMTNEQFDIEIARVSEGFCRFCELRLEPSEHFGVQYGACRCCGYQMALDMTIETEEGPVAVLSCTGWPAGVGGVANVGKCEHVAAFADWNDE